MASKRSKKYSKKKWVCSEGCRITKEPCSHLLQLIEPKRTQPLFESVNRYVGNNTDKAQARDYTAKDVNEYEYGFRKKLERAGLNPVQTDILTLRFVYDMTFSQIAEDLKIVSTTTVIRLFEEAAARIKKLGKI